MKNFLIIGLLCVFSSFSYGQDTLFDLPKIEDNAQEKAEQLFEMQRYKESFGAYLTLAQFGDKYSQYMISFHYLNGLGVKKNRIQAYGWANLARKSKAPEVQQYYLQVKSRLRVDEQDQAEKIKLELFENYNDLALAMRLEKVIRNTIPKCAGSRIRGNCTFIRQYCLDNGSQKSYQNCLREAELRDPAVIRVLRQDLAKTKAYIKNKSLNAGKVSIEEFSSPEEEKPETEEK